MRGTQVLDKSDIALTVCCVNLPTVVLYCVRRPRSLCGELSIPYLKIQILGGIFAVNWLETEKSESVNS